MNTEHLERMVDFWRSECTRAEEEVSRLQALLHARGVPYTNEQLQLVAALLGCQKDAPLEKKTTGSFHGDVSQQLQQPPPEKMFDKDPLSLQQLPWFAGGFGVGGTSSGSPFWW